MSVHRDAPDRPDSPLEESASARLSALARTAGTLTAGAALLQAARSAEAAGPFGPIGKVPKPSDAERILVQRITLGLTAAELTKARSLGYSGYLEYQLNNTAIADTACENFVATNFPGIAMSYHQIQTSADTWRYTDLAGATLHRSVFSNRQLYQRMVEFWSDHFNIHFEKSGPLKLMDDRDVIRVHALGKFPDLLKASAHSVAMLEYLDNVTSNAQDPNQNYARELMELHTLGVGGGYTQQDVIEVARCLTGWSRVWDDTNLNGTFQFHNWQHDYGAKTVLGTNIPANGGQSDGDTVLNILAAHPSTARFIGTKLTKWFLGIAPSDALLTQIVNAYNTTGGDIKAMLRVILAKENVLAAPPKLKRPYHLVVSALRASGAVVTDWSEFYWWRLPLTGQPLFLWPAPNGYPDSVSYWGSSLLPRWNLVANLTSNYIGGVTVSVSAFTGLTSARAIADAINDQIFQKTLPIGELVALQKHLAPIFQAGSGVDKEGRIRDAIGLAMSFPTFQQY